MSLHGCFSHWLKACRILAVKHAQDLLPLQVAVPRKDSSTFGHDRRCTWLDQKCSKTGELQGLPRGGLWGSPDKSWLPQYDSCWVSELWIVLKMAKIEDDWRSLTFHSQWLTMMEDDWRWSKMIGDDLRWSRMIADDWRWLKMLKLFEDDWRWLKMIEIDWRWLTMIEDDWSWLKMDEYWTWLRLIDIDWMWLKIIDWRWLTLIDDDWRWLKMMDYD